MRIEIPFRNSGKAPASPVAGAQSQLLADLLHGKHYNDTLAGQVFSQTTTPLGSAIPIYTSTTPLGVVLWNPLGSGVNAELISVNLSRVSGTQAFGTIGLMARKLTAAVPPTAFAEVTPINGLIGAGNASACKSSNAGTITIAAGTAAEYIRNLVAMYPAIDTTAIEGVPKEFDFNGTVIVPPGIIVWLAGQVATVALFAQTLVWKEIAL